MWVTLKGLPDKLRSAAWPSSVRAVRCPVKAFSLEKKNLGKRKTTDSQETNEIYAISCYCFLLKASTLMGLPVLNGRKE
jgi:hypothetical protein